MLHGKHKLTNIIPNYLARNIINALNRVLVVEKLIYWEQHTHIYTLIHT